MKREINKIVKLVNKNRFDSTNAVPTAHGDYTISLGGCAFISVEKQENGKFTVMVSWGVWDYDTRTQIPKAELVEMATRMLSRFWNCQTAR